MVECLLFIGAGSRSRSKTDRLRNTAGGLCPPRVCEHASASFIIFLTLILFLFGDKNSKFRPKFLALLICRILFALCLVQRLVYIFHFPGKVDTWRGRGEFIFLPKIVHFIFLQNCELLLWK